MKKMTNTQRKRLRELDRQARPIGTQGAHSSLFGKLMQRHEVENGRAGEDAQRRIVQALVDDLVTSVAEDVKKIAK